LFPFRSTLITIGEIRGSVRATAMIRSSYRQMRPRVLEALYSFGSWAHLRYSQHSRPLLKAQ
jgi:hypothetical protein